MWTASYAALKDIRPPLAPVSISRGKPRWLKGGWLNHCQPGAAGRNYEALAPTYKALAAGDDEYDRAFNAILCQLDPAQVYADLGGNAVLLCFCAPGKFCHRRVVAEWFEHHLGVIVPELGQPRAKIAVHAGPLYGFHTPPAEKHAWIVSRMAELRRAAMTGR